MSTIQTQDSRTNPAATGREGDAPSAPAVKQAPTTGPSKKDIEAKSKRDRHDRVKPTKESEATAHRAVREAVQVTENAGSRWRIAADALKAHYGTLARAAKARDVVFGWMAEGLPQADRAALAVAKSDLKNATEETKEARKNAGTKLSVYWKRMCEYAFPKAVEKAKAAAKAEKAAKDGEEGEGKGAKSVDERARTLVAQALDYIQKNQGFGFDAIKAATHLAAAKQIMGEGK